MKCNELKSRGRSVPYYYYPLLVPHASLIIRKDAYLIEA
jgi:hypothetical protein